MTATARWVGAAAAMPALLAVAASGQTPTFRTRVDLVAVDVAVRRGNAAVTGLTAADFQVSDNGVLQRVDEVFFDLPPIDVTLVLDVTTLEGVNPPALDVREIGAELRAVDRLGAISSGRDVIDVVSMQSVRGPIRLATPQMAAGRSFLDGTALALMRPPPPDRRHLVVSIAGGFDTASVLDAGLVREVVRRTSGVVYVVLADALPEDTREAYGAIAALTGGRAQSWRVWEQPLAGIFKPIFEEFRQSYVLVYRPCGVTPGGWHELNVTGPRRADVKVRARSGTSTTVVSERRGPAGTKANNASVRGGEPGAP